MLVCSLEWKTAYAALNFSKVYTSMKKKFLNRALHFVEIKEQFKAATRLKNNVYPHTHTFKALGSPE